MRTTFTIQGQDFDSLVTADEATRWAVLDRSFPDGTDADATANALVKASYWLSNVVTIPQGEPSEEIVRCVVRLATFFVVGELKAVPPSPLSVSNAGITVDMRYAGSQDQDDAHRFGFPDVESYRLVKVLIDQGGRAMSVQTPSSFVDERL